MNVKKLIGTFLLAVLLPALVKAENIEVTMPTTVVVLATAVPTTVPTPQVSAPTNPWKTLEICNMTNQDIVANFRGSTTVYRYIVAGTCWWRNYLDSKSQYSGAVSISRQGTLPTTGSVIITGDQ